MKRSSRKNIQLSVSSVLVLEHLDYCLYLVFSAQVSKRSYFSKVLYTIGTLQQVPARQIRLSFVECA